MFAFRIAVVLGAVGSAAAAGDAVRPVRVIEELPTLRCLGVRWLVEGDDNRDARVQVAYRKAGEAAWHKALDLFRVAPEGMRKAARPARGQFLFAGSVFGLEEDTEYEVRLRLSDPDGGGAERTMTMRTWAEPKLPEGGRRIVAGPGELKAAFARARPGEFRPPSGRPGKPIALVGEGRWEAVFDAGGASNAIAAPDSHDLMLENLAFRNARWALNFNSSSRITVRRCLVTGCEYGLVCQRDGARQQRLFIADCTMRGPCTWPRSKGIESARGIQLSGQGHVVCYNRISGYADGIDTFSTYPCSAIDIYRNEISECTDDGIEMDYSEHNTRCFENRLTNVYQGISTQPVWGGPVYVLRNALYNVGLETFKMHNTPSGALFFHNTSVKAGMPLVLYTGETVRDFVTRNNLFIGTRGNYAYESTAPMQRCDFDYDGFGGEWKMFLKWNRVRYATMADARAKAPVYKHAVRVNPATAFASGVKPPADVRTRFQPGVNDLRLREGSEAIDAGVALPNINDGYAGKAPDLGAYELGQALPHYGPRPLRRGER